MADSYFTGDRQFWGDPDFHTTNQIVVYSMLWQSTTTDIAGIHRRNDDVDAQWCRMKKRLYLETLKELGAIGKICLYEGHIWVKPALWYNLYKGRHSQKQLGAVVGRLKMVAHTGLVEDLISYYREKYSLKIPYPMGIDTHPIPIPMGMHTLPHGYRSESESESDTETESESSRARDYASVDKSELEQIEHPVQISQPELETRKPSVITRIPGESDAVFQYRQYLTDNWPAVERLIGMVHYCELVDIRAGSQVEQLTKHIVKGTIATYLQTNSDEALASLKERDGGAWDKYIRRWLQRDLKQLRAGGPRPSIYKEPMTAGQEQGHYTKHQTDGRERKSSDFTPGDPDAAANAALERALVDRDALRQCYTDKCRFEGTEWTKEGEAAYLVEHESAECGQ